MKQPDKHGKNKQRCSWFLGRGKKKCLTSVQQIFPIHLGKDKQSRQSDSRLLRNKQIPNRQKERPQPECEFEPGSKTHCHCQSQESQGVSLCEKFIISVKNDQF